LIRRDAGIIDGFGCFPAPKPGENRSFHSGVVISVAGLIVDPSPRPCFVCLPLRAVTSFPSRERCNLGCRARCPACCTGAPRGECRIVRQAVTLIHLERAVRLSRKRSERSRQSITRRLIHLLIRRNTRKYRMCILQRRRTCELPYRLGPVYRDAPSGASFWAARWAPQRLSHVLPIGAHSLGKNDDLVDRDALFLARKMHGNVTSA
jgi:hypothetical protein